MLCCARVAGVTASTTTAIATASSIFLFIFIFADMLLLLSYDDEVVKTNYVTRWYGKGREGEGEEPKTSSRRGRGGRGGNSVSEKDQREPIKGTEQGNRFVFAFGF